MFLSKLTKPIRRPLSSSAGKKLALLRESQYWELDRLKELQWSRLSTLLVHCYDSVPYYRELFDKSGCHPQQFTDFKDLQRLPILEKSHIQKNGKSLLSTAFSTHSLVPNATGGSTGTPLNFYHDRSYMDWADATRVRAWKHWVGYDENEIEAVLWGSVRDIGSNLTLRRAFYSVLRDGILALNTFDLDEKKITVFLRYYKILKPRIMRGYASSLTYIAGFIKDRGIGVPSPGAIISSTEVLYPHMRRQIEDVFGARVFDSYGCREVSHIAEECGFQNGLHVCMETQYVEVIDGDIIVTNLSNFGMPFVRYRVGDRTLGLDETPCPCGRKSVRLSSLTGRDNDNIELPNGKIINGEFFEFLFFGFDSVRQFQVIFKKSTATLHVYLNISSVDVPIGEIVRRRIEDAFDFKQIEVHYTQEFSTTRSGKLRFVYAID